MEASGAALVALALGTGWAAVALARQKAATPRSALTLDSGLRMQRFESEVCRGAEASRSRQT